MYCWVRSGSIIAFYCWMTYLQQAWATVPPTKIQTQIHRVTAHLEKMQATQSSDEAALKTIDLAINSLSQEARVMQIKLTQSAKQVHVLQAQHEVVKQHLSTQNKVLSYQLRNAYFLMRENYFKVILNQEDPTRVRRMLLYYRFFNQARLKLINQLDQDLQTLETLTQRLKEQRRQYAELVRRYQQQTTQLMTEKSERTQLLAKVSQNISIDKQQLEQLMAAQETRAPAPRRLFSAQVASPRRTESKPDLPLSFGAQLGKLHWPTRGKIMHHDDFFGSKTGAVFIKTQEGQDVHAIYAGRVVFAGWLRGMGLLVIVDHGNGYMSLYGRNESLHHRAGDWVESGELIATAGQSGGYTESGLYFSVRYKGKPTDPAAWCA